MDVLKIKHEMGTVFCVIEYAATGLVCGCASIYLFLYLFYWHDELYRMKLFTLAGPHLSHRRY